MHKPIQHCTRRAFDGCRGGPSCHQCPGEAEAAPASRATERWLVALIIITAFAGGVVGHHSFERVERVERATARV